MKQFTEALADSDHKMKKADSQVQTMHYLFLNFATMTILK